MKSILFIFFASLSISSFAQNDKLAKALISHLKNAKTFQDVEKAISVIKKADKKYKQF